jgi:hypothetical protein
MNLAQKYDSSKKLQVYIEIDRGQQPIGAAFNQMNRDVATVGRPIVQDPGIYAVSVFGLQRQLITCLCILGMIR